LVLNVGFLNEWLILWTKRWFDPLNECIDGAKRTSHYRQLSQILF